MCRVKISVRDRKVKENKMEMKWDYYALLPPSNQGGLIKLPPYGGSLK